MKKIITLVILISLIFSLNAVAEEKTGLIRGKIYNSDGRIVENVKVEIKELEKSKIVSDGSFEFDNLKHTYDKQPYTFVFKKDGYITKEIKRDIGINRLTLLNVKLEKINNKVKGNTLKNTKVKINDNEIYTETGEYSFSNIKPGNYNVQYERKGYDPVTKKIEVKNKEVVKLPFQDLIMNEVNYDNFEENTLIANYFFGYDFNLDEMFYPYYYLRKNNLNKKDIVNNVKLVMSSFILVQDFEIINYINSNNFENNEDLIKAIKSMYKKNPEKIKKELKILTKLKEDINKVYSIDKPFTYSVYHINISDIKYKESNPEVNNTRIFKEKYLNRKGNIELSENEIEESRNITKSIKNISELKAEELVKFKDSYLITSKATQEHITYKIRKQNINREQIDNIYQFFNLFDSEFISNFVNPYILKAHFEINDKWKVIFNEN